MSVLIFRQTYFTTLYILLLSATCFGRFGHLEVDFATNVEDNTDVVAHHTPHHIEISKLIASIPSNRIIKYEILV